MTEIINPTKREIASTPFFFRRVCGISSKIKTGTISFYLPNRSIFTFRGNQDDPAHAIIHVRDFRFARRTILGGDIGFFESFADGEWDSPDLAECMYVFARNADHVREAFSAAPFVGLVHNLQHRLNKNTRHGSKRNIISHYDLGNAFYEKWLDPTMTYSSARFPSPSASLKDAQVNKYASLAKSIELKPDEKVLEIGSGWGGFAEFAAKHVGARVTGLTLSPSQLEYARRRIFKQGLNEKVEFRLQDYRDVEERFDKVASIEMFEAVGKEYWATYFNKIKSALKPGGAAGLQIITIADRFFDRYSSSTDFIQRYVFPGGILPSKLKLKELTREAGLGLRQMTEFGQDYALTLNKWHTRFLDSWDEIRPLGFDERFKKLWRFYLAYCEAGFRAGNINVMQMTAARP